jgi:hypothetical protein
MKMKPSVTSALLALGLTACVDGTPALQIGGAAAQGTDCSISASTGPGLLRGTLDLTFRAGSGYPLVLAVTSNLSSTAVEVGGTPVSGDEPDTIYITRVALKYSTSTPGLTLREKSASVPIYGTLDDTGNLLLNLLTPTVIEDLNGFVPGNAPAEVLIKVQLRGERVTGDEVESNEITFPLSVYESGFTCPTGQVFAKNTDACPQIGLNNVFPECEDAAATP